MKSFSFALSFSIILKSSWKFALFVVFRCFLKTWISLFSKLMFSFTSSINLTNYGDYSWINWFFNFTFLLIGNKHNRLFRENYNGIAKLIAQQPKTIKNKKNLYEITEICSLFLLSHSLLRSPWERTRHRHRGLCHPRPCRGFWFPLKTSWDQFLVFAAFVKFLPLFKYKFMAPNVFLI